MTISFAMNILIKHALCVVCLPLFSGDEKTIESSKVLPAIKWVNTTKASPDTNGQLLFKIRRDRDKQELHYTLHLSSGGQLNVSNPIKMYWVKNGKKEALTKWQIQIAYGLTYKSISATEAVFHFACTRKKAFHLIKSSKTTAVYVNKVEDDFILSELYLHLVGPLACPVVTKIDLTGKDSHGHLKTESFKP